MKTVQSDLLAQSILSAYQLSDGSFKLGFLPKDEDGNIILNPFLVFILSNNIYWKTVFYFQEFPFTSSPLVIFETMPYCPQHYPLPHPNISAEGRLDVGIQFSNPTTDLQTPIRFVTSILSNPLHWPGDGHTKENSSKQVNSSTIVIAPIAVPLGNIQQQPQINAPPRVIKTIEQISDVLGYIDKITTVSGKVWKIIKPILPLIPL